MCKTKGVIACMFISKLHFPFLTMKNPLNWHQTKSYLWWVWECSIYVCQNSYMIIMLNSMEHLSYELKKRRRNGPIVSPSPSWKKKKKKIPLKEICWSYCIISFKLELQKWVSNPPKCPEALNEIPESDWKCWSRWRSDSVGELCCRFNCE